MAGLKAESISKVLVEKLGYIVVELLFVKRAVKLVGIDSESLGDALVKKSAEVEVGLLSVELLGVKANLMEATEGAIWAAVDDKAVELDVELLGITPRTEAKTFGEALFGNLEEVLFERRRVTLVRVYSETLVE